MTKCHTCPFESKYSVSFRKLMKKKAYVDPDYLYCPWEVKYTAGRFALTIVGVAWASFGLYAIFKLRSWLLTWVFFITAAVFAVSNFVMMCVDSYQVNESNQWCKDWLKDDPDFYCEYTPYALTCFSDALNAIAWVKSMSFNRLTFSGFCCWNYILEQKIR